MQIQAKIGGILYDRSGKLGSNYPDLELGREFWNRVRVPSSNYKSLILRMDDACGITGISDGNKNGENVPTGNSCQVLQHYNCLLMALILPIVTKAILLTSKKETDDAS